MAISVQWPVNDDAKLEAGEREREKLDEGKLYTAKELKR